MAEYLFSRAEGAPAATTPPDEVGWRMFFQMWATRQHPFEVLADGDTLWWADQTSREVRWELRVRNVRRAQYTSVAVALERLRRWFGVLPADLTRYHQAVRPEGWLLAWESELVGPVGQQLPTGERLGRNGFRRLDHQQARQFGLPAPGRPAAFPIRSTDEDPDILAPPRVRHIPLSVQREVFERDQRRCQRCGTTDGEMHLDHIHPWSKGGSNTVDNLQILCARCNLAKGAAAEAGRTVVPSVPSLAAVARRLDQDVPTSPAELQALLEAAVAAGLDETLKAVIWDLDHHPDRDGAIAEAVAVGLDAAEGELGLHVDAFIELFDFRLEGSTLQAAGPLEDLLNSGDDEIAARVAAHLSWAEGVPDDRKLALATRGLESSDLRVRAIALVVLAGLTEDDRTWGEHLTYVIEHGDPFVVSVAALELGAELADDAEAYPYLELALRSPAPEIAQLAAESLAERFADEPAVASIYRRKAQELADLVAETESLYGPGSG